MLYVADDAAPDSVWTCTLALVCTEAALPSGFGIAQGITASGGMLYVVDTANPRSVWTCTLALVCTEAALPSGGTPAGHNGQRQECSTSRTTVIRLGMDVHAGPNVH